MRASHALAKWRADAFGSAYPCNNLEQAIEDVKRFGFNDELLEKFFYGNACKLLGLA